MKLNQWLNNNADTIQCSSYSDGLYDFVDFCRRLVSTYGFDNDVLYVHRDFQMSEPDIHGNSLLMPIIQIKDEHIGLNVLLKLDFSLVYNVYTLVDLNSRELGMPSIFQNQYIVLWSTSEEMREELAVEFISDESEKNTTYVLPNEHEVYAFFSGILNYEAFCV